MKTLTVVVGNDRVVLVLLVVCGERNVVLVHEPVETGVAAQTQEGEVVLGEEVDLKGADGRDTRREELVLAGAPRAEEHAILN